MKQQVLILQRSSLTKLNLSTVYCPHKCFPLYTLQPRFSPSLIGMCMCKDESLEKSAAGQNNAADLKFVSTSHFLTLVLVRVSYLRQGWNHMMCKAQDQQEKESVLLQSKRSWHKFYSRYRLIDTLRWDLCRTQREIGRFSAPNIAKLIQILLELPYIWQFDW